MRKTARVLLLGIEEWRVAVHQALPKRPKRNFWGVNSFWDLCALTQAVAVDVAVFHRSFSLHDLRFAAEYIRRRWPDAVILVIGEQVEQLDDPLYDDNASDGISPDELVQMIETSVAARRRAKRNVLSRLGSAQL